MMTGQVGAVVADRVATNTVALGVAAAMAHAPVVPVGEGTPP